MHFWVYKHDFSLTEGKEKRKVMILLWKMTGLNCIIASYFYAPLKMFDNSFITIVIMLFCFLEEKNVKILK